MEFSRQEYCRGLSFPSPWDLPHSGIESGGFCKASRYLAIWGFPGGSGGKESTCKVGDLGLIAGLGRSPREGTGYPPIPVFLGFPGGSAGIESTCNVGDLGLIPGLGRSPEEENDCHCREKTTKILWNRVFYSGRNRKLKRTIPSNDMNLKS